MNILDQLSMLLYSTLLAEVIKCPWQICLMPSQLLMAPRVACALSRGDGARQQIVEIGRLGPSAPLPKIRLLPSVSPDA